MIEENVKNLLAEIGVNSYGEKVTLLAATKTRTPEEICRAIGAGIEVVGENRAQEVRDKLPLLSGNFRMDFIGRLQGNKVKYVVGKCALIHSVDRYEIAEEIARQAEKLGAVQDVLLEVNIGGETSKGGFSAEEAEEAYLRLKELPSLRPRGLMAMLPESEDEGYLAALADGARALFERIRKRDGNAAVLSMGMSGDWRLCIAHGSNLVRLGTAIFGARQYPFTA